MSEDSGAVPVVSKTTKTLAREDKEWVASIRRSLRRGDSTVESIHSLLTIWQEHISEDDECLKQAMIVMLTAELLRKA